MNRRTLITGLVSLIAAPAIVRASSLMAIRAVPAWPEGWVPYPVVTPEFLRLYEQFQAMPVPEFQMVGPEAFQLIREFGN